MDYEAFLSEWLDDSPTLTVHTSGSTGAPKPIRVEKRRMEASARITCRFLGLQPGDAALLCLPLDYIAGKMMAVRALTCGLRLTVVQPSSHPLASDEAASPFDFAAMVPLQVHCSLATDTERQRLQAIRHLIIGGGPVSDSLASALRHFPNAVWSTYGMTETLSHIALRRLSGPDASEWYTPFEGVRLELSAEGCLVVSAPAVHPGPLVTNDRALLRPDGTFRILGRRDNVVCSGGVKIQMEEVERLLQSHVRVPFIITKAPHGQLGEQVVMLVERAGAVGQPADTSRLQAVCQETLPRFWRPRHIIAVSRLPATATGKPARAEALRMAARLVEEKETTNHQQTKQ